MAKAPTAAELDAWLEFKKITSIPSLRNYILETVEQLKVEKVTNAEARKELRLARSALSHLKTRLRG
jgi:hypothetical protein